MRSYLWQVPHTYILIGYSVVVLVGLVLTSALVRPRTSRSFTTIMQPALMLLSIPGPVILGSFLQAHAFIGPLSLPYHGGTPESRCLGAEGAVWTCDQIMMIAILCTAVLTLVAVSMLFIHRALAGRRGQPADDRKWPHVVLILALVGTALVVRGPFLRNLMASGFLGDCLYASEDLPVSSVVGKPAGRIPRLATMVKVNEDAILVNYVKVASLESWDPGFDITGPLVSEIEHRLEMRNESCERGREDVCDFPDLLIGASREAPLSALIEVIRIACSAGNGPCSLLIRTEPVPDPPQELEGTIEAVTRDGRFRCTVECPYALIGVDTMAGEASEAGGTVLPDDPGMTFGEFIEELAPGTTSVVLERDEAQDSASGRIKRKLVEALVRGDAAHRYEEDEANAQGRWFTLESVKNPLDKFTVLGGLGFHREEMELFLETSGFQDDGLVWHQYLLEDGCLLDLKVEPESEKVMRIDVECELGREEARIGFDYCKAMEVHYRKLEAYYETHDRTPKDFGRIDDLLSFLEGIETIQGHFELSVEHKNADLEDEYDVGHVMASRDGRFLYVLGDPPREVWAVRDGRLHVRKEGEGVDEVVDFESVSTLDPVARTMYLLFGTFDVGEIKAAFASKVKIDLLGSWMVDLYPKGKDMREAFRSSWIEVNSSCLNMEKPSVYYLVFLHGAGTQTWIDFDGFTYNEPIDDPLFEF